MARSIGARDVIVHPDHLFGLHWQPAMIRSDNGREFVAQSVQDWLRDRRVEPVFIVKASPQQNCYVERFNGSVRDELLNGESFRSATGVRVVVNEWLEHYNQVRPHRALKMMTPAGFAALASATEKQTE